MPLPKRLSHVLSIVGAACRLSVPSVLISLFGVGRTTILPRIRDPFYVEKASENQGMGPAVRALRSAFWVLLFNCDKLDVSSA
jgi:hypothetical protein